MTARPQQWGKYELIERLGRGGMGEVWKARITGAAGFSRTLVVKRLLPHLLEDQRFVEMFLQEARLSAQLEHPNIVQIFELGDVDGEFFLAMEFVQGRDLARVIGRYVLLNGRPPVPMAVYVVREVCRALSYAHQLTDKHGARLGLIHRDISPSNVMLSSSGAVKLLDFGVAKAAHESQNQATQTGVLKGKLWYMAPERVEGHSFDHRSDIFSTGVVLHEALTATRLFEAQNPAKVINLICTKEIEPPSRLNAEVPPELDRICLRALARDPAERYASAEEMASELDELTFKLRWGAEQLAKLIQTTFPPGTQVAASALDPTSEADRDRPPADTVRAKGPVTPAARAPASRETTAPVARAGNGTASRETTAPVARQVTGFIDGDETALRPSPPTNTTQRNPVLPDADTRTQEAPLPPMEPLSHAAAPERPAPMFDDATTVMSQAREPRVEPPAPIAPSPRRPLRSWTIGAIAALVVLVLAGVIVGEATRASAEIELTVTSNPAGARVFVDGAARIDGTTPLTTRLPRGDGYTLRLMLPGYEPYAEPLAADKDLRLHVVLRPLR